MSITSNTKSAITSVSEIEKLVIKNFPFEIFNPGQKEVIIEIVQLLEAGNKHIIVSAPTGSGKSVIAMTVHAVIREMRESWNSVLLTTSKGLQDQYNKEFGDILVDVKGKNNYPCIKGTSGYNSTDCIKEVVIKKCGKFECPYVLARDKWINYQGIKTTNSSFFLKAPDSIVPTDELSKLDLCIIDECHEIDKVIVENTSIEFDHSQFNNLKGVTQNFINAFSSMISILDKFPLDRKFSFSDISDEDNESLLRFYTYFTRVQNRLNDEITKMAENSTKHVSTLVKYKKSLEECKLVVNKLALLTSKNYKNYEWVKQVSETKVIKLVPICSNTPMTNVVLFDKAKQFVHMSATICGVEQYAKNLGVTDYVYISENNYIPVESRTVHVDDSLFINYATDRNKIVAKVDAIVDKEKGNGVIHTVSFQLAHDIKNGSKFKNRMIVSNNREEILAALSKKTDCIILSPSIETGYDFKGDLARWQIIAKMPYLNLTDTYIKERKNKSATWYARETILRLVQASGRVTRGVNDFGVTYVIDANILNLLKYNLELFPDWFLESLQL